MGAIVCVFSSDVMEFTVSDIQKIGKITILFMQR